MRNKLLLIINPNAGQRRANRFLPEIIRLYNDYKYNCEVYVTAGPGDASVYLEECSKDYERVICIGGDGTLNETIAGLSAAGMTCPAGYIPAGTTNDYAASIGLSSDIMQAARDSVEGVPMEFDLGLFNGRNFNYTASCGAFAKASYSTPQAAKNAIGHLAYIMEGIWDIPNIHPIHLHLTSDDNEYDDEYIFCSITNSLSVGGILKLDPDMVSMNDGLFEVMLVKYPKNPVELTRILTSLRNFDLPNECVDFFTTRALDIVSDEMLEWTLDGERGDSDTHFEVVNLHRKMKLILPQSQVEGLAVEKQNPCDRGDVD